MITAATLLFLLTALLYYLAGTNGPHGQADASQSSAMRRASAKRVVSLAPSVTEIIFALGANVGSTNASSPSSPPLTEPNLQLVGRTRFCLHPPNALAVPEVGGLGDPSIERLLSIRPDLIVATSLTSPDVMDQLRSAGFATLVVKHEGVEGILRDIQTLGDALGKSEQAEKLAGTLRFRLEQRRHRPSPPTALGPKVLFLYDADGLYSAGPHSFASELIALAGGDNLGDKATSAWPQLSMEFILASKPDVIVVTGPSDDDGPDPSVAQVERARMQSELITKWRADARWQELDAVRLGRVIVVPGMPFTVPGPRMVDGVESISNALGFSP